MEMTDAPGIAKLHGIAPFAGARIETSSSRERHAAHPEYIAPFAGARIETPLSAQVKRVPRPYGSLPSRGARIETLNLDPHGVDVVI